MNIKLKPNKYGLKIISLNDADTSNMIHVIPYLGKTTSPVGLSVSKYLLKEATILIHSTCDNWFTSVNIFQKMLTDYKLSFTGTKRKNKRQIPQEMKIATKSDPAKYCYTNDLTLLSFNKKKTIKLYYFYQHLQIVLSF